MTTELDRLLDQNYTIVMRRNALGSITAFASRDDEAFDDDVSNAMEIADQAGRLTDHFTADEVSAALADKVFRVGDYSP